MVPEGDSTVLLLASPREECLLVHETKKIEKRWLKLVFPVTPVNPALRSADHRGCVWPWPSFSHPALQTGPGQSYYPQFKCYSHHISFVVSQSSGVLFLNRRNPSLEFPTAIVTRLTLLQSNDDWLKIHSQSLTRGEGKGVRGGQKPRRGQVAS